MSTTEPGRSSLVAPARHPPQLAGLSQIITRHGSCLTGRRATLPLQTALSVSIAIAILLHTTLAISISDEKYRNWAGIMNNYEAMLCNLLTRLLWV